MVGNSVLRWFTVALLVCGLAALGRVSAASVPEPTIHQFQQRWAVVNYQLKGKDRREAFDRLTDDITGFVTRYPERVEGWIWSGIIKSTYAGVKSGLGALKLAKGARLDLKQALKMEPGAMSGSAYTSLGALYFKVPGWPIGFGSDKKARKLLLEGLRINPDGIDSNYFYAEFLRDQGKLEEARKYYLKAQQAPPRPARPLADQGRQLEIRSALERLDKKLKK